MLSTFLDARRGEITGKDVPSEASEYSNPEVAIGLTILSARHEGLRRAAVQGLLRGLRDDFAQDRDRRDL